MKLIVACDRKNGIGNKNALPWRIKEDLSHFSYLTKGNGKNCVIMGRHTYESIGKSLPRRHNIVLSTKNDVKEGITIINSIDDLFTYLNVNKFEEVWVIGGSKVYETMLSLEVVDEIYMTIVEGNYDCDVYFPELSQTFKEDKSYTEYRVWSGKKVTLMRFKKEGCE